MSSEVAIEVEDLSKAYLIYAEPRDRLLQALMPRLNRLLRRLGLPQQDRSYRSEHWALHSLSFEVGRGETVAIIGRNGSGKSTLLQLVCGTLTPTTGEVRVQGRVAALLELGSGFNPEYTGRENVILNASVLGLSREVALARMDSILAFADIGEFVDQPVKTYSSGMAMRLAFAVIAHVDADVLIIDEALAVGDAMFQQKCFRWLRDFQERGTVLYCGHDLGAVTNLCQRAIWLDRGHLRMVGTAKDVAEAYGVFVARETMGLPEPPPHEPAAAPAALLPSEKVDWKAALSSMEGHDSFGMGHAIITHAGLGHVDGATRGWFTGGEEVILVMRVTCRRPVSNAIVGFTVKDRLGQNLIGANTVQKSHHRPFDLQPGEVATISFRFVMPFLMDGDYVVACAVAEGTQMHHTQHHWVHEAAQFKILDAEACGALLLPRMTDIEIEIV
jgi:lipopolysaccharide transport system ATP-binding protein